MDHCAIEIVASYLLPNMLAPFFISHNISLKEQFRYNASKCDSCITISLKGIDRSEYYKIYSIFPNIILTGIAIQWIDHLFVTVNFKDLVPPEVYIRLKHIFNYSCNCGVASMNIAGLNPNLITIVFPVGHIEDISPLFACRNLKVIDMSFCFGIKDVNRLIIGQHKLRAFGYPRSCEPFSFPKKLKVLAMFSAMSYGRCRHWRTELPCPYIDTRCVNMETLSTSYLHSLELYSHTFVNIPLCENVKNLVLRKCKVSVNPDFFPRCANLSIIHVNSSYDMSFVVGLKSLCALTVGIDNIVFRLNACPLLNSFEKINECKSLKKLIFWGDTSMKCGHYIMETIGKCISLETLELNYITDECDVSKLNGLINLRTLTIHACWGKSFRFPDIGLCTIIVIGSYMEQIMICGKVKNVIIKNCPHLHDIVYEDDCTLFDAIYCGNIIFKKMAKKKSDETWWRKLIH